MEKPARRTVTESEHQASRDNNSEASFQFNRHSIEIKEGLLGKLRLLAKKENSTLFIVLLTALVATLYVSTGQHEIRVGTLVANRRRREIETTIGHFVNTVILSTHVSPKFTLKHLLGQVRDVISPCAYVSGVSDGAVDEGTRIEAKIDRASLFRVLLNYQKHDSRPVNAAGLTFASWNVPYTKF